MTSSPFELHSGSHTVRGFWFFLNHSPFDEYLCCFQYFAVKTRATSYTLSMLLCAHVPCFSRLESSRWNCWVKWQMHFGVIIDIAPVYTTTYFSKLLVTLHIIKALKRLPVWSVNIIRNCFNNTELVVFSCIWILGFMWKMSSNCLSPILKLFNGAFVIKFKGFFLWSNWSAFRYGSAFMCCLKWLSFPRDDKKYSCTFACNIFMIFFLLARKSIYKLYCHMWKKSLHYKARWKHIIIYNKTKQKWCMKKKHNIPKQ